VALLARLRLDTRLASPGWEARVRLERDSAPLHKRPAGDGWYLLADRGNQRGDARCPEVGAEFRFSVKMFAFLAALKLAPRGLHPVDLRGLRGFSLRDGDSARARIKQMIAGSEMVEAVGNRLRLKPGASVEIIGGVTDKWIWPNGRKRIPLAEQYEGISTVAGAAGSDPAPPWRMTAWFESDYPKVIGRYVVVQEGTGERIRGRFHGAWCETGPDVVATHISLSYRGEPPHDTAEYGAGTLEACWEDGSVHLIGQFGGNPLPQDRQPTGHPITLAIRLWPAQGVIGTAPPASACSSERAPAE